VLKKTPLVFLFPAFFLTIAGLSAGLFKQLEQKFKKVEYDLRKTEVKKRAVKSPAFRACF